MSPFHGFGTLTLEAIRDAIRRRIVAAIAVLSLLSLMVVDSCSGCSNASITVNEQARDMIDVAGYSAAVMFTLLGLWIITLAGVLGADHLTQTLEDGSAPLGLARPVGREVFAFSRLCGSLLIVALAGVVLLGGTAFLFVTRNELPPGPALLAGAACAIGSVVTASFAMAASLVLPRLATWLLVVGSVGLLAVAGGFSATSAPHEGWLFWLADYGPPLASSMAAALGPWMAEVELPWAPTELLPRLVVWALLGLVALALAFRRREIAT